MSLFNYKELKEINDRLTAIENELNDISGTVGRIHLRLATLEKDMKQERLRKAHDM